MCNDGDGGVRKRDGYGKKELEELAIKREREDSWKEKVNYCWVCALLSLTFSSLLRFPIQSERKKRRQRVSERKKQREEECMEI